MANQYKTWLGEKRGCLAVRSFAEKGWNARYTETLEEAKKLLFETLPLKDISVGLGGSETLGAMDILPILRNDEYKFYDRYDCLDHFEVCRNSLMADCFITGANALTMSGVMVNLDCSGSRVAAMAYGPRRVIVVAGVNKLVDTLEEAITRVHAIAPMNCKRNGHKTPCAETGICANCNIPDRMCNHLLITYNAQKFSDKYTLILVNEDHGF
ncbi:MAG: lactate utilization protein [Treponema sp.]|jgi:hypothetical protein|nr:lactate utilization protein [Treponema sp.]